MARLKARLAGFWGRRDGPSAGLTILNRSTQRNKLLRIPTGMQGS
jgi:hypothetical protein